MNTVNSISEMQPLTREWRQAQRRVALVPTMGGLHAGQAALIRAARAAADVVVVAAFVNPLQFSPNEVVEHYPSDPAADRQLCEEAGADVFFAPAAAEIYPPDYSTFVTEERLAAPLCGVSRPMHFRGVATLTTKLLNIVQPQVIYFGQKTAQRVAVVRKLIADLGYSVEVAVVPTEREPDGLAYGLVNREFTAALRSQALAVYRALTKARAMVEAGVRSPDRLIAEATHILGEERRLRVIYIAIVDPDTMEPLREVLPGKSLLAISAWVDEHRLVDNILL
ncbi:pantoate--beta-alanine ligase [Cephaloticoccus primus]|uniref:Pantothenate synthetase n=1 Tax=Cephaloticoccus primus TaxID=1548207 RepID=A0A139SLA7_9BACT|nr:pantoate--beta-alanine ligase [Cephaloticoccus primus]KXU35335.1 pantoate--beta-alanine ligase [Cephaloticoccus primus]